MRALRDVVQMASVTEGPWEREESKLAVRQLRALLAVAREAEKFANHWDHYGPKWRPLQRAVDRLKRASTPKASKP